MKRKHAKIRANCLSLIVVFWILSFLMYACGSGDGSGSEGGTGSISFNLVLAGPESTRFVAGQQINQAEFDCTANEIDTIGAQVFDQNDELIAEGGPFDCNAGKGSLTGVPVGENHLLVVSAKNSGNVTTFSGEVTVAVREGITTDVGTITLDIFNQPPVLDPIGNKFGTESVLLSFNISAKDPNLGDVLTFEAGLDGEIGTLPEDAELVDNGNGAAVFNWTPRFDAAGLYNILFKVTDNGENPLSDSESITITIADVAQPPPPPENLAATKGTFDDRISLTWSNVDNENEYRIFRADSSTGTFTQIDTTGTDVTSYDDGQGCGSSGFWYKVQAVNVAGSSGDSNIDSGFTMTCAPINALATPLVNEVLLRWDEVSNADSYTVYWAPTSGETRSHYEVLAEDITETSYSHTGLDTRRNYYVVTAVGSNGESPESTEISAFPWLIATIDSPADSDHNAGRYTSIDLDSENYVHISYYHSSDGVKHATNTGNSWSTEVVDPEGGGYTSIAMDSNDFAHISYLVSSDGYYLHYATNETGSWVIENEFVNNEVFLVMDRNTSIAVDKNGIVKITCIYNTDFEYIQHVFQDGDGWSVDDIGVGDYASLALDSNNHSHISLYQVQNGNLNYFSNAPDGIWLPREDVDTSGDVGQFTSIVVNQKDNNVHISYSTAAPQEPGDPLRVLKYSNKVSGNWLVEPEIVDTGDVGWYNSLAIDDSNKFHISYYDSAKNALKYATNFSGTWVPGYVDTESGNTGQFTSIAADDNDNVHISYYDAENGNLKYATKAID